MCAERRIYTHITTHGTQTGNEVQPKGSSFLYCDPLPPNSDPRAKEAGRGIRREIERAVDAILADTPSSEIDRSHLIAALEHAGRSALASVEGGGPVVAASALLICEIPPKEPHFTETLIAGAGECRVFGVRETSVDLIFCDPFHEDTPPGLSVRERYTVSTNLLGLETDLDVHIRRLRENSYHSLVVANYAAYTFLSQGDQWKSLRGRSDAVSVRAEELFTKGHPPEGAELWVISKRHIPMSPLQPPKGPSGSSLVAARPLVKHRAQRAVAVTLGGLTALLLVAGGYAYFNATGQTSDAHVEAQMTPLRAISSTKKLNNALAMAEGSRQISPLPLSPNMEPEGTEADWVTWGQLEIERLQADLAETESIVGRIKANEDSLAEALHARDDYVSTLEQEIDQLKAAAADPLVECERTDDKIADLQYLADDYQRLRDQYDAVTSLVAEDARRTEELQQQLDAQQHAAEQIQAGASQQQEEILALHEMLAEAEARCAERDQLLSAQRVKLESLETQSALAQHVGGDGDLDAAGQRLVAAQRSQLESLQKNYQKLAEEHQLLSSAFTEIQSQVSTHLEMANNLEDCLKQEQEKQTAALAQVEEQKRLRQETEERLKQLKEEHQAMIRDHALELSHAQQIGAELELSEDGRLETLQHLTDLQAELKRERRMRQAQETMLRRLSGNVQQWKRAFQQLEQSREELANELAELRGPQRYAPHYRRPQTPSAPLTSTRIHLVSPGDTLNSIAMTYYNSSEETEKILQANRDKISDPEHLRVGTALVVP